MAHDEFTKALDGLTNRLALYRIVEAWKMALEIKGLRDKALQMRRNIDDIHKAYDGFNAKAPEHVSNVQAIASQVDALNNDLEFATQTLKNSVEEDQPSSQGQSGT